MTEEVILLKARVRELKEERDCYWRAAEESNENLHAVTKDLRETKQALKKSEILRKDAEKWMAYYKEAYMRGNHTILILKNTIARLRVVAEQARIVASFTAFDKYRWSSTHLTDAVKRLRDLLKELDS